VEVGRHTYGHEQITVRSWGESAQLRIGSFCSIADRVEIFLGGNHRADWVTTFPFPAFAEHWPAAATIGEEHSTKGDVVIGNDVWIGSNATILSGVTVGDGAVIGADSTVAADVAPYAVVAGNPARQVRLRFGPQTIERLLEIRWWEWPDERIQASVSRLCSGDVEGFLDAQVPSGGWRRTWRRLLGSSR
jgi:acetyltransferase-like isoleucine patch superfamily enzyme